MENKVMTAREFYTAVIALADVPADLADYATKAIAALDDKNAKRKVSKAAMAHKAENDNIKAAMLEKLTADTPTIAADLAAALGISTQKVSALARQLAEDGTITILDGVKSAKGKVKGYVLAANGEDTEDGEDTENGEDIAD